MHVGPYKQNNYQHQFVCDCCGQAAGEDADEGKALQAAYALVEYRGWISRHPGWRFYCVGCKECLEEAE